jgi:hypothetical protein
MAEKEQQHDKGKKKESLLGLSVKKEEDFSEWYAQCPTVVFFVAAYVWPVPLLLVQRASFVGIFSCVYFFLFCALFVSRSFALEWRWCDVCASRYGGRSSVQVHAGDPASRVD